MTSTDWAWLLAGLGGVLVLLLFTALVAWHGRLSRLHQRADTGTCTLCAEPYPCRTLNAIGVK